MRKLAVCVLLAGGAALIAAPARTASYYYNASPRIITIEPAQEIEPPPQPRPRPAPRRVAPLPPATAPATFAQPPVPQPRRAVREVVAPRPAPRASAAPRDVFDDEQPMTAPPPAALPSPPPALPPRPRTVLAPPPYAAGPTPLKPLSHRDSARFAPVQEKAAPALDPQDIPQDIPQDLPEDTPPPGAPTFDDPAPTGR